MFAFLFLVIPLTSGQTLSSTDKQAEGNVHLYRVVCAFLAATCLILLLVAIVLGVKRECLQPFCACVTAGH